MAHWPDERIQRLFNIKLPIIQAPMAGSSTTEMAIAVAVAGGLGSLPSAQMTPAQLTEALIKFRKATSAPVNVNFFCHTPAGMTRLSIANGASDWKAIIPSSISIPKCR